MDVHGLSVDAARRPLCAGFATDRPDDRAVAPPEAGARAGVLDFRHMAARLRHPSGVGTVGKRTPELAAGSDIELGEHLPQVVGDRVLADDQARSDFAVGEAVPGEPRDLSLSAGHGHNPAPMDG
jgi:hypothetical protein